jgi:hypothetical protein
MGSLSAGAIRATGQLLSCLALKATILATALRPSPLRLNSFTQLVMFFISSR